MTSPTKTAQDVIRAQIKRDALRMRKHFNLMPYMRWATAWGPHWRNRQKSNMRAHIERNAT